MIEVDNKVMTDIDGENDLNTAFTDYEAHIKSLEAEAKKEEILSDRRCASCQTTYKQDRAVYEIGGFPIAHPRAHALLEATFKILRLKADGELKHVIAPKN